MKKNHIIAVIAATVILAGAGVSAVMAAPNGINPGFGPGRFIGRPAQNLTDEQREEMKAKADAVKAAVEAGDYDAWVKAVKAIHEDSPMLGKITADNFDRFAEAHSLRKQADGIMEELGLGRGAGLGFGPGMMGGQGSGGMRGGMHGGMPFKGAGPRF